MSVILRPRKRQTAGLRPNRKTGLSPRINQSDPQAPRPSEPGLSHGRASVPRSHRLRRPQARRLNAAGFSFAVVGRGELLLLPFKAMLLSECARGRKSGSPPLFAPSFKVQGDIAHNQSSGFRSRPRSKASTRAGLQRSIQNGVSRNQRWRTVHWRRSPGPRRPASPGPASGEFRSLIVSG
jgi:hypothetical protein